MVPIHSSRPMSRTCVDAETRGTAKATHRLSQGLATMGDANEMWADWWSAHKSSMSPSGTVLCAKCMLANERRSGSEGKPANPPYRSSTANSLCSKDR